eukprot:TRINITY_DN2753_c0_g7_i1.p2 TRINITY_DN2753_c0_g7~~TRINITY_DN2753_c0_g7_i1.p2  ORF type:complete len:272 (+),score=71.05 TRINITY_DN2753_c0_g7_i1:324-1139(+)
MFKRGRKHGTGILTLKSGGKYSGEFESDLQNGNGSFYWANGDVFHGHWVKGKRSGRGKYRWADGDEYEGEFLDNKRTGKGKFTYASGSWYEGDYVEGTRNGFGAYHWANGSQYIGEFKLGVCEGKGVFIQFDGWKIGDDWVDDKPVNATFSPQITQAVSQNVCTFFNTGKQRFGQLFYQTKQMDDRPHGVCVVCAKVCAKRNGMAIDVVSKFGGNFFCDCGSHEDSSLTCFAMEEEETEEGEGEGEGEGKGEGGGETVSYTHLTLPTICSV